MNLYAIRDILVDYYMPPFPVHTDRDALHAVAAAINNPENRDALAKATHHFQLWKLAEIDEDGNVLPLKTLLADCSSLVRTPQHREGEPDLFRGAQSLAAADPRPRYSGAVQSSGNASESV